MNMIEAVMAITTFMAVYAFRSDFFFFSEITERNSARFCDMFGRGPYEEVVGPNLGVLPYIVGPKSAYFRMV